MKAALCYLSCDRPELVRQSLPPLVEGAKGNAYHLYVADGSRTKEGEDTVWETGHPTARTFGNVRGGAGAAIVFALTTMLASEENYTHVGFCETDVLLPADWFPLCCAVSDRGRNDGLDVGAVSARCYEDRVLVQRDGYAVCHNLGAGHILFSRRAAEIVLHSFRTAWSTDNRRIFAALSGTDIGAYWAFRGSAQNLTADWHWDTVLAAHGLASLALTPSPVEMIGQDPPLEQQGLKIVRDASFVAASVVDLDGGRFDRYAPNLHAIRTGLLDLNFEAFFSTSPETGAFTVFPHQVDAIGGRYEGDWRLRECRGFGTFAWEASSVSTAWEDQQVQTMVVPTLTFPAVGPCTVLVGGGTSGGKVRVEDLASGFSGEPDLPPEQQTGGAAMQVTVPSGMQSRDIRVTMLTPGSIFYGIQFREPQPRDPRWRFDHSVLPKP